MGIRVVRDTRVTTEKTALDRGLIGDWRLYNNARGEYATVRDHSGYGNHGVVVPTVDTKWVTTERGYSLEVDNANDDDNYVSLPTGLSKQPVSAITYEVLVYQTDYNGDSDNRVFECNDGAGGGGSHHYMLSVQSFAGENQWRARINDGGVKTYVSDNDAHVLDRMEHVVFTWNKATYAFWVNGQAEGSGAIGDNDIVDPGTDPFYIGAAANDGYGSFGGRIVYVRLYDRVFTTDDVQRRYQLSKLVMRQSRVSRVQGFVAGAPPVGNAMPMAMDLYRRRRS